MLDDAALDLRRLRVLQEVDRRGTVSAAALALHLTPSAVSQQLSGLSKDLGVPLLDRVGRGVRLTGQAHVLLGHAALVSEQMERARADLAAYADGGVGLVRVGSLSTGISAVVAPSLPRLRATRPGLEVQVVEVESPENFLMLDAGELDVVVTADYRDAPRRSDPRYHRVDLITDRMDVVLPQGHPLAGARGGIRLASLRDEAWVSAGPDDTCSLIMLAVCAAAGFSPDVRHQAKEWDGVSALVAAGAGVALVPRLAQPLRQRGLVTLPVVGSPASRLIFGAVRAGTRAAPPAGAVLAALVEVAAERPDAA